MYILGPNVSFGSPRTLPAYVRIAELAVFPLPTLGTPHFAEALSHNRLPIRIQRPRVALHVNGLLQLLEHGLLPLHGRVHRGFTCQLPVHSSWKRIVAPGTA